MNTKIELAELTTTLTGTTYYMEITTENNRIVVGITKQTYDELKNTFTTNKYQL